MQRSKKDFLPYILPVILYLVFMAAYPLAYSLWLSFHEWNSYTQSYQFVGFTNFSTLFQDSKFSTVLQNTIIFTLSCTGFEFIFGLGIALWLNQKIPAKGFVRGLFILPTMTTPIIVGMMGRLLLNPDIGIVTFLRFFGIEPITLVNSPYSLLAVIVIDIWQWTPFIFLILYAGLQSIPSDPYESALIDGASKKQIFRYITIPLLRDTIAVAILFRAIDAFRTFDIIYSVTYGGPLVRSATLSFFAFLNGYAYSRVGYASATSYIMVIIIAISCTVYSRVLLKERFW